MMHNAQLVEIRYPKNTVHQVHGRLIYLGRSEENDVVLEDPFASKRHALIEKIDDGYVLRDLSSRNGTLLNWKTFTGMVALQDRDEIIVGRTKFVFWAANCAVNSNSALSGIAGPLLCAGR